jgi:hypothetical protein
MGQEHSRQAKTNPCLVNIMKDALKSFGVGLALVVVIVVPGVIGAIIASSLGGPGIIGAMTPYFIGILIFIIFALGDGLRRGKL